ncbi:related to transposases [Ustilago trichophora]|uniref:Related to transposases n=1 Tax=Ustilago trichophora TaxID=86804 RepID=A0A5C3DS85_9BASI|nr:related to transposases [Ustilago trichophora]
MPQRPFSKRSVAFRAASAADRDTREVRLQRASLELDNGQHDSIRQAAAANNVPEASLRHRRQGRQPKVRAQNNQQRLTPTEESGLLEFIRRRACSGFALTPALLREHANNVIHSDPARRQAPDVTHTWLQAFLLRHPTIWSHWSRCLDNARLSGATETVIQQWFNRLAEIMREYNVASTNIYNMDETGFMFGQAGSERIIVPSGEPAARYKAQPGTRELATIIECIGSGGQVLSPLIITKGRVHTVGEQRQMEGVPGSWRFAKTDNGWTSHALGLEWLETIFEPETRPSTPSTWRLLIIDGHKSHTSELFLDLCWNRNIIPFLLPAHATHVMQPLDVSIFGPLSASVKRLISDAATHVSDVDKPMFVTMYAQAREKVLMQARARKAFSDSGITLNPSANKVLDRLPGSGTQQHRQPLQERAVPNSRTVFETTVAVLAQEQDPREARKLGNSISQAHAQTEAALAASRVEVDLLRSELERRNKTSTRRGKKRKDGDQRVLTRTKMITRAEAEQNLVGKGAYKGRNTREEEVVEEAEEAEAVPDGDKAVPDGNEAPHDGDEGLLASPSISATPAEPNITNNIDPELSLDAINDDDLGGFGFFDIMPVASSSRVRL